MMESSSVNPAVVRKNWEDFQTWMQSTFQYMHQLSESDKQASILAAAERRVAYEDFVTAQVVKQRRIAAELAALAEAEKAEFLRVQAEMLQTEEEREEAVMTEAEKLEAEMKEEIRAEAARKEAARLAASSESSSTSDSRLSIVEQKLHKFTKEQVIIKQKLEQHDAANATMTNMLTQILNKLFEPSTSKT